MKKFFFTKALTPQGWRDNVTLNVSNEGIIVKICENSSPHGGEHIKGYALPGMANIHSHAFQRAMAGLAEYTISDHDSFWTWRDVMYRFSGMLEPDDLKIIADQLYMEMMKAGYISVTEFHYLHHDPQGNSYANPALMSEVILKSAEDTGIALTHLPVLYQTSGFGGPPLQKAQKRFGHDTDAFCELLSLIHTKTSGHPQQKMGAALHSLRAVPAQAMDQVIQHLNHLDHNAPLHIHISEQIQEVEECLTWSGKRPVEWLYDNAPVDQRWCLIHATHLTQAEIKLIAKSGATIGLCPTTEANLGDGLFPLADYLKEGGRFAIGSDSHMSVSPVQELRWLEYGQRLKTRSRNIATDKNHPHTGDFLYAAALKGGAMASGFKNGAIEVGKRADIIILDPDSPSLAGTDENYILDRFIFNGDQNLVRHVIIGGRITIQNGHHFNEETITDRFITLMEKIKKRGESKLRESKRL